MLFNSTLYLVFLCGVVSVYYQLTPPYRRALLLLASFTFYWVWSIPFSLLLVASAIIDYGAARWIGAARTTRARRTALGVSVVFNLGILALFKYVDFFVDSAYSLFGEGAAPALDLVLPLGISFYTFQTMSYTIDVYRGVLAPKKSFLDVALYVSFFPQLVAGPIVRADVLMPQLSGTVSGVDWTGVRKGAGLIIWGLLKKVYVADTLGRIVDEAYGAPDLFGGLDLALATYAFAVQIYCDFSGYSDIAIGSALLLGIRLPKNFDSPYLACSLREFWRRWHISLSTWLRDYLYIPLGGNRHGRVRTYVSLMVTMVLGGLWHGAGWNWVVWGAIHGVGLSIERMMGLKEKPASRITGALRWLLTLHLVCLSWVFFRAGSLGDAVSILGRIVRGEEGPLSLSLMPAVCLGGILLAERFGARRKWLHLFESRPSWTPWLVYASALLLILTFAGTRNPEFIYFQF